MSIRLNKHHRLSITPLRIIIMIIMMIIMIVVNG